MFQINMENHFSLRYIDSLLERVRVADEARRREFTGALGLRNPSPSLWAPGGGRGLLEVSIQDRRLYVSEKDVHSTIF